MAPLRLKRPQLFANLKFELRGTWLAPEFCIQRAQLCLGLHNRGARPSIFARVLPRDRCFAQVLVTRARELLCMLQCLLPIRAPNRSDLRATQVAEAVRMRSHFPRHSRNAFTLRKLLDRATSWHTFVVNSAERGIEAPHGVACLSALLRERRETRAAAVEFARCAVARPLQLHAPFEPRQQVLQRIQFSITSAAAIPPKIPAASARRITFVCIHCARSACRFSRST